MFTLNPAPELPRTFNKEQYKASTRWLRIARNEIEPKVNKACDKDINDMVIYGRSVIEQPDGPGYFVNICVYI